jgi:hypothetical protein
MKTSPGFITARPLTPCAFGCRFVVGHENAEDTACNADHILIGRFKKFRAQLFISHLSLRRLTSRVLSIACLKSRIFSLVSDLKALVDMAGVMPNAIMIFFRELFSSAIFGMPGAGVPPVYSPGIQLSDWKLTYRM